MTTSRAKTIVPGAWAEKVEDIFHIILGIVLLGIAAVALVFTMIRLFTTAPFFPTGMIQAINDVLFIIIILEILRTVIARYTDGVFQLQNFLIIGIIAAVRHILTVGASMTLGAEKPQESFDRAVTELGVSAAIVVALVFAIFLARVSDPETIKGRQKKQ
ncbi:MAG: phosphate-starvation-inducible PsiE family protein [Pontimonas sp.]